jgi:hypothetical protein
VRNFLNVCCTTEKFHSIYYLLNAKRKREKNLINYQKMSFWPAAYTPTYIVWNTVAASWFYVGSLWFVDVGLSFWRISRLFKLFGTPIDHSSITLHQSVQ